MGLYQADYTMLRLLKFSPFERRGDRWRFGTRTIGDSVVARLIASGRVERHGDRIVLIKRIEKGAQVCAGASP